MRRVSTPLVWGLTAVGLAGVLAFMAWVAWRSPHVGGAWTGGSVHILVAMAIGVGGSGALAAGLLWLAFYSARHGYDDRVAEWEDGDGPG